MRGLPRRPSLPHVRIPRRAVAGALVALAMLVPGWLWVRDSSLVGITKVNVTGLSGPQASVVRQAIVDAADGMSTLHVQRSRVEQAVARFPIVGSVTLAPRLLHTLDVQVRQLRPVGALRLGDGRELAVAADGTVLEGTLTRGLPAIAVNVPPGGARVTDRKPLRMVELLTAAPAPLRGRVASVTDGPSGLAAQLRDGPELRFGPSTRLGAKWAAAATVLADVSSRGAAYLDLRVPERPAAGPPAPAEDAAVGTDAGTTTGTQPQRPLEVAHQP